jgi:predicted phosphoribosyltransferase
MKKRLFRDRQEAGQKLAVALKEKYPAVEDGIILALPRGGVVVGNEVAKALGLPLDIVVTRKIGAPMNPEYAVAAISENELVISERENPDPNYLKTESAKERQEIQRRLKEYRGSKLELDLENKTVFLIDDGLATGLTMAVAIKEVRLQNPAKIIIAVPVAPPETVEKLRPKIDEIIVLNIEPDFFAVSQFYDDFPQVGDNEVKKLLLD